MCIFILPFMKVSYKYCFELVYWRGFLRLLKFGWYLLLQMFWSEFLHDLKFLFLQMVWSLSVCVAIIRRVTPAAPWSNTRGKVSVIYYRKYWSRSIPLYMTLTSRHIAPFGKPLLLALPLDYVIYIYFGLIILCHSRSTVHLHQSFFHPSFDGIKIAHVISFGN